MRRKRKVYFLLIIMVILLGLFSRTAVIPSVVYPYLGDYIYALLWFCILGFLFPEKEIFILGILSVSVCYFIEFLQLYQANWINTIRNYRIGGLVLGHGFLWSDIISYTLGGITGYFLESIYYKIYLKKP